MVQADFYVLPVAACQAILGVQWLETLGLIETDYKKLSMSFTQADRTHILKGMISSELAPMSEKELLHLLGMRFFVHVISYVEPIQDTKLPPELNQILSEFAHVFEEPTDLPPKCSHDH